MHTALPAPRPSLLPSATTKHRPAGCHSRLCAQPAWLAALGLALSVVPAAPAFPILPGDLGIAEFRLSTQASGAPVQDGIIETYGALPASRSTVSNAIATDGSGNFASGAFAFSFLDAGDTATLNFNTASSFINNRSTSAGVIASMLISFVPEVDLLYSLSGAFRGDLGGKGIAQSVVDLRDESYPYPYSENERAFNASSFAFNLDLQGDGSFPNAASDTGSLTGTLLAGHSYSLQATYYLDVYPLDLGPGSGTGASSLQFRLTQASTPPPVSSVPDTAGTAPLLGLALLSLLAVRRRETAAHAG